MLLLNIFMDKCNFNIVLLTTNTQAPSVHSGGSLLTDILMADIVQFKN